MASEKSSAGCSFGQSEHLWALPRQGGNSAVLDMKDTHIGSWYKSQTMKTRSNTSLGVFYLFINRIEKYFPLTVRHSALFYIHTYPHPSKKKTTTKTLHTENYIYSVNNQNWIVMQNSS